MRKQLGAILIENRACTPRQVAHALEWQRKLNARNHYKHIGAILLEMKYVTLEQLHRALAVQQLPA